MGITDKSLIRLNKYLPSIKTMLQIGCQNIYTYENNGGLAHPYFESLGIKILTIDITGCQGSEVVDLRILKYLGQYDIVTDYGCGEHVDGNYYQFHHNIHTATKQGGLIIHENPRTGHWPGHGCNYIDMEFYKRLAELCGYEILELCEEYAMGNTTDGCNISVVLRKMNDNSFITESQFKSIGHVYSK